MREALHSSPSILGCWIHMNGYRILMEGNIHGGFGAWTDHEITRRNAEEWLHGSLYMPVGRVHSFINQLPRGLYLRVSTFRCVVDNWELRIANYLHISPVHILQTTAYCLCSYTDLWYRSANFLQCAFALLVNTISCPVKNHSDMDDLFQTVKTHFTFSKVVGD